MEVLLHCINGRAVKTFIFYYTSWFPSETREEVVLCTVYSGSGEVMPFLKICKSYSSYLKSQCLVYRGEDDEFSPVFWLFQSVWVWLWLIWTALVQLVVAEVWGLVRLVVFTPASTHNTSSSLVVPHILYSPTRLHIAVGTSKKTGGKTWSVVWQHDHTKYC